MRVLVLGSGAKDHAITWWFSRSRLIDGLYAAPGNVGTKPIAVNLPDVDICDPEAVYRACVDYGINFVFVGTEAPLFTGVIDYLNNRGINTFGAPGYALKLEGDRCFARQFANRHGIPCPEYKLFEDEDSLSLYLKEHKDDVFVVKKNTLAPSRIMIDSSDYDMLMAFSRELLKETPIVLEQHISGMSVTISVLLDEDGYLELPYCSEYTRTEKSSGAITGGMGAICPISLNDEMCARIRCEIIEPTLNGLKEDGLAYRGVLTFSIIVSEAGPLLVDYHVRFNDPATQAFVPLIENDVVELMEAMKSNTISKCTIEKSSQSSVCVVLASEGYPSEPVTGRELKKMHPIKSNNLCNLNPYVFFGAVTEKDGKITTSGGRCVSVIGHGVNIISANEMAYNHIDDITFEGAWYRDDIGRKFFAN